MIGGGADAGITWGGAGSTGATGTCSNTGAATRRLKILSKYCELAAVTIGAAPAGAGWASWITDPYVTAHTTASKVVWKIELLSIL